MGIRTWIPTFGEFDGYRGMGEGTDDGYGRCYVLNSDHVAHTAALVQALERIVSDFECDYVLDGVVVDNPSTSHRKAWEVARAALDGQP